MSFFIGGTGRSGTSILTNIFKEHPSFICFLEPRFFIGAHGMTDLLTGKCTLQQFKKGIASFRTNIVNSLWGQIDRNIAEKMYAEEVLLGIIDSSFRDNDLLLNCRKFSESIFSIAMSYKKRTHWIEKTPHTVKVVDMLYKIYPDMKYIHVIREPKEVFCSVLPLKWGPSNVSEFVRWYDDVMSCAKKAYSNVPSEQYNVVSLESLGAKANKVLPKIFEFFEINTTKAILDACNSKIIPERCITNRWEIQLSSGQNREIENGCYALYNYWKDKDIGSSL